jgi:hypothetical protein
VTCIKRQTSTLARRASSEWCEEKAVMFEDERKLFYKCQARAGSAGIPACKLALAN